MQLPHLLETEIRNPVLEFSLPYFEGTYGFYWVSSLFWVELLLFLLVEVSAAIGCGWAIYSYVIEPKNTGTTFAYLFGYGLICPLWIVGSESLIHLFGVRNIFMRFVVGCMVPTKCIFTTSEAINGFSPPHATKSMADYLIHYASVALPSRDKNGNLIKLSMREVTKNGIKFLMYLFTLGIQQSLMSQYKYYSVFKDPVDLDDEWFSIHRFITWQLYANSFFQAVLFQLYLCTYLEALRLVFSLGLGYQMKEMMGNPLFGSSSPSDFWGRRWNLVVHSLLKGGIFKPVRRYFSTTIAVIATFLASGALHEWILCLLFIILPSQVDKNGECISCYSPTYGNSMIFFIWQAALIAIESLVGQSNFFRFLSKKLLSPIRTALVVFIGLPFAHFFLEPYMRSDFFLHAQQALPMFLPL